MRIFITGATGFIGSHTVQLLKETNEIMALTRRDVADSQINYIKGDLSSWESVKETVKDFKPDAIIHLAWEGIPDYSYETSKKNVIYAFNILELCRYSGCKRIVIAGSCWEYDNPCGCVSENSPLSYENSFKTAKNFILKMTEHFCDENNISYCWLRMFYVYGPGQKSTSIIPHILANLSQRKLPDINAPFNENDFVYVKDVARCIAFVLDNISNESMVLNIGSGTPIAIINLLKIISDKMQIHINLEKYCSSNTEKRSFFADISKLNRLGFTNNYSISDGIEEVLRCGIR